jgi:dienelactone hydrolase/uncharacterized damage-inducible protein DinB
MSRLSRHPSAKSLVVALLGISGVSFLSQAQLPNRGPRAVAPKAQETLDMWNAIGDKLLALAEEFPENKYDFRVTDEERTFAENLLHVAAVDFDVVSFAAGSTVGPNFGENKHNPSREVYRSKEDVVKLLRQAVTDGAEVLQRQGDAGLDRVTTYLSGNRQVHCSYAWLFAIEHSAEHYGQLVVYFRANHLVPPDSRRGQGTGTQQPAAGLTVSLIASDGTPLKASYFPAAKAGPGVVLVHQVNRERKAWNRLAAKLAAAGINALTLDMRGHGDSGGIPYEKLSDAELRDSWRGSPADVDAAFEFLASQPGVRREVIGLAGAGLLGVDNSVQAARRHSLEVKSLVLLSGETFLDDLRFLRTARHLPGLFVVADDDEYPPTVEAMELLYIASSNPGSKLVHYSSSKEAPWLWYEPFDLGRVPANGGHGTDMLESHPELAGIIVDWFVTTLIETPGHAPADTLASALVLRQIQEPGGVARVTQQLKEGRKGDPQFQLFPEVAVDIIGADYLRKGETKAAIDVFKLNLLAYPDSADAQSDLADAYLANGERELARRYAESALKLLDSAGHASSWSNTEPRRRVIRRDAERILNKLDAAH